jgi:hypothetical protein
MVDPEEGDDDGDPTCRRCGEQSPCWESENDWLCESCWRAQQREWDAEAGETRRNWLRGL